MPVDAKTLTKAREGDLVAREKIIRQLMADPRTRGAVYNLRKRGGCLEAEDVEAEFWRGVLIGLDFVRHDIGDPMAHLVQRGVWQVKSAVREEIGRRVVQHCSTCGKLNGKYNYARVCSTCGGAVENVQRMEPDDDLDERQPYLESIANVTLDVVRMRLSDGQRRVFEALLSAHYDDPESPVVGAARTLGISRQRMHQHIGKIRRAVGYLTEA